MHVLSKMYLTCNKTNFFQWSKSEPDRVLDKLLNYCFVNLGNFELLSTVLNTPVIKQFGLIADAIMTLRQHVIILKRGMLTDSPNTQLFQTCLYHRASLESALLLRCTVFFCDDLTQCSFNSCQLTLAVHTCMQMHALQCRHVCRCMHCRS